MSAAVHTISNRAKTLIVSAGITDEIDEITALAGHSGGFPHLLWIDDVSRRVE
jgi:hypothetical protein